MSNDLNKDKVKGRAKQAAGALTGNKDLEAEGERDEAKGKAKSIVDKVADKADDAIDKVTSKDK